MFDTVSIEHLFSYVNFMLEKSLTNYLQNRRFDTYWANTSANTMVSRLISRAAPSLKRQFAVLMDGQSIEVTLKENILWEDLERDESLMWGLLLAAGYITGVCLDRSENLYQIRITNREMMLMFGDLFLRWFSGESRQRCIPVQRLVLSYQSESRGSLTGSIIQFVYISI